MTGSGQETSGLLFQLAAFASPPIEGGDGWLPLFQL